ncbi:MAG: NADH-quinone oxidoreductase subunit L [Acidimicrobiales bacterium]
MLSAVWLIPALPLLGVLTLVVFGRRLADPLAGWLATGAVAGSFAAAVATFIGLIGRTEHERQFVFHLFSWIPSGELSVDAGFLVDPLSITMALFVTGVATLIHLYSIGYMHGDARYPRFFVYLNLFAFSMLMLVLGDNLVLTFLGWEGVGACSYLLISFWFERESAAVAGKKAFITNRVGDWGFMVAIFLIFATMGSVAYVGESGILEGASGLSQTTAVAISLLLFVGAAGKSAQLPLYVWLPDAMEGPTPVSALIHAATMVTSGVYLMVRINPILGMAQDATWVIAIVGAATALFAATCAVAQRDIKKVLAYSTVSQLGFMFLAVGSGAYVAAIFHMVTHAFFKALLFLGAGSVIHGMHHEQDMRYMGGLRKLMPITGATFIVGWLAIAGVPPFAGFWSKDEILAAAFDKSPALWVVGILTAVLTAYYMSRQIFMVFYGELGARAPELPDGDMDEHVDSEAHSHLPKESPSLMWIPLVVLAVAASVAGGLNLPGVFTLEHFLEPIFIGGLHELTLSGEMQVALGALAIAGSALGILAARSVYLRSTKSVERLEPEILRRAWRVDEVIAAFFGGPGRAIADGTADFDRQVVDGAVNGVGVAVREGGTRLRETQTGYVRHYALGMAGGAACLLAFFFVRVGL